MLRVVLVLILFRISFLFSSEINLPIDVADRQNPEYISLTSIGKFAIWRVARPGIPAHFHTGVDIKRPTDNYINEFILPMSNGLVISRRDDGPYAQLIIEHTINEEKIWSLYEHIAGIIVEVGDSVRYDQPIARFVNYDELNTYGWQFDHFHFEILKVKPMPLQVTPKHPRRFFNSYTLICYSKEELDKYFFNPIIFFKSCWL